MKRTIENKFNIKTGDTINWCGTDVVVTKVSNDGIIFGSGFMAKQISFRVIKKAVESNGMISIKFND